jgi:L-alanine-DL-glutamate epimerase-like enolase superfamily enzyme
LDVAAQKQGISLARYLNDSSESEIAVNATIGATSTREAVKAATQARDSGFQAIKLKVGMASNVEGEIERVGAVRQAIGPDMALRLDANGAWNTDQAIASIRSLERFGLELIEQPTPPNDFSALLDVRNAVSIPIAADESITGIESANQILKMGAVQALVLKPMMLGGLRTAYRIAQSATVSDVRCIITTTIDAGVATAAALHLAAAIRPQGLACGLATSELLATDLLVRPLEISSGRMKVPSGPGLGVQVSEALLFRFASGIEGEAS